VNETKRAVTVSVNPALDASMSVDHVMVDRKLRCSEPEYDPGGGGINSARVLRTLGTDVVAVYPIGGPMGAILVELLEAEGLPSAPVRIAGWTRENFTVRELASNQQYQFVAPGPTLEAADLERMVESIADMEPRVDFVVLSGSLAPGVPTGFYASIIELGHERGFRVAVDVAGEPLRLAVKAGPALIKPNLPELEALVGRQLPLESDQEDAIREVLAMGPVEAVIASLGAGGAVVGTAEGISRLRAPTVRVKSRVGAGDSMVGGMVHAVLRGETVLDAARLGVACGSATCMQPGTRLCAADDVDRLLARIGA
jgi:6-phosphofructokinase 2